MIQMMRLVASIRCFQISTDAHGKTNTILICSWIRSVIDRMDHYKAEHNRLLKEHMTQLELAVWKAKLDDKEDNSTLEVQTKRAKVDVEAMRQKSASHLVQAL